MIKMIKMIKMKPRVLPTKVLFLRAIRRNRYTYERKESRGRAKPQRAQRAQRKAF
jgi:hypothetical protein